MTFTVAGVSSVNHPIVFSHALIAFTLGLRHAVDCDHLAAIDNVTRQLMNRGQWPVSVGFWFALGHSTIVMLLTSVLAGGYSWAKHLTSDGDDLSDRISLVAGLVSIFLLGGIGLLNAQIAIGLLREWWSLQRLNVAAQEAEMRHVSSEALQSALSALPGVRRVLEQVSRPWKMYGVGFLFGLSFDSATQVGLIGLAAMSSTSGRVPPLMLLIFPVAFSCGMCFVDTCNGVLMLATYSWTNMRPIQKLFYNFVVTAMSAGIALIIVSLEALQIVAKEAALKGEFWTRVQAVDMATIGYSIILSFLLVFVAAVVVGKGCAFCRHGARGLDEHLEVRHFGP